MNICIDLGNSTIGIGLFKENILLNKIVFNTDTKMSEDEFYVLFINKLQDIKVDIHNVKNIIFSSVVPSLNLIIINVIKRIFKKEPLLIGPGTKTGLSINVDSPLEIGNDLIADLVGAKEQYGYPLLIVDLGTASKILLLDKKATFSSCLIMPGLTLSAQSLTSKAALLPEVSLIAPKTVLARNTLEAMNAGIVYGHAEMINGLLDRCEKELGYQCQKVLTGGGAIYLEDILGDRFIYNPHLNLEGLNIIISKNNK